MSHQEELLARLRNPENAVRVNKEMTEMYKQTEAVLIVEDVDKAASEHATMILRQEAQAKHERMAEKAQSVQYANPDEKLARMEAEKAEREAQRRQAEAARVVREEQRTTTTTTTQSQSSWSSPYGSGSSTTSTGSRWGASAPAKPKETPGELAHKAGVYTSIQFVESMLSVNEILSEPIDEIEFNEYRRRKSIFKNFKKNDFSKKRTFLLDSYMRVTDYILVSSAITGLCFGSKIAGRVLKKVKES